MDNRTVMAKWFREGSIFETRGTRGHKQQQCSITGCAVAQHCYNGHVGFLCEKWNFDLL